MSDIGLDANALVAIIVAYSLAWACVGAAVAFSIIERRDRKKAANSKRKHTPINLTL